MQTEFELNCRETKQNFAQISETKFMLHMKNIKVIFIPHKQAFIFFAHSSQD